MSVNMHYDYADRKNGRQPVTYIHPDAEEVLSDTYGLMIYQESVMRMSQRFAGYSLADADNLRKACGKKIREMMAKERAKFEDGCEATGYGRELGKQLFDIIEGFADYAFNKSHTFGYGLITYQTAYLKAHYPVEYLACLLTSVKASLEKAAVYLADCRAMGIRVLNPDVNLSASDFTALAPEEAPPAWTCPREPGVIPFGLSAVRNVGEGLVALIVAERERADRSPRSTTSSSGSTRPCSTSAASSRSSRAAPSTPSAIPARACCRCSSRSSTPRCSAAVSGTRV